MREPPDALRILQDERTSGGYAIPAELVGDVYRIEHKVQFDESRRDVYSKLRESVNAVLDAEDLGGPDDGDAI